MRRRREFFGICYLNCVPLGTPMLAPPPHGRHEGGSKGGICPQPTPLLMKQEKIWKKNQWKLKKKYSFLVKL